MVSDSGPGVQPDIMQQLFTEGISTKGSGRGLGLSLVREAVGALKGEIRYEYHAGARFFVVLPIR